MEGDFLALAPPPPSERAVRRAEGRDKRQKREEERRSKHRGRSEPARDRGRNASDARGGSRGAAPGSSGSGGGSSDMGLMQPPPWRGGSGRNLTSLPSSTALLRLHEEILEFADMMSPTPAEMAVADAALARVRDACLAVFPTARLEVFGSRANGLVLPTSDWDVVLFGVKGCSRTMHRLAAEFRARKLESKMEVIDSARVPIVKLRERASGVNIDISFDAASGVVTRGLIAEVLARYPAVRPLVLVLKYFLIQRGLNETYSGGIGSFLLVLMVTHVVQIAGVEADAAARAAASLQQHASSPSHASAASASSGAPGSTAAASAAVVSHNGLNLGFLLLSFFELYGFNLNYMTTGISLRGCSGPSSSGATALTTAAPGSGRGAGAGGRKQLPQKKRPRRRSTNSTDSSSSSDSDSSDDDSNNGSADGVGGTSAAPSVGGGGCYYSKSGRGWRDPNRPHLLSMESPVDSSIDVGKNSWAIQRVRRAFAHAHTMLARAVRSWSDYARAGAAAARATAVAAEAASSASRKRGRDDGPSYRGSGSGPSSLYTPSPHLPPKPTPSLLAAVIRPDALLRERAQELLLGATPVGGTPRGAADTGAAGDESGSDDGGSDSGSDRGDRSGSESDGNSDDEGERPSKRQRHASSAAAGADEPAAASASSSLSATAPASPATSASASAAPAPAPAPSPEAEAAAVDAARAAALASLSTSGVALRKPGRLADIMTRRERKVEELSNAAALEGRWY